MAGESHQTQIELREALARGERKLLALHQAALALTADLELQSVLQRVADLSREVIGTRYAALGVLDESGERLSDFITAGLDPAERRKIAHLPSGEGLLGYLIKHGEPVRVERIIDHKDSAGFCGNHPPMGSLLGVPVVAKGQVLGDLYLSDKLDGSAFSQEDEDTLVQFAAHAAAAIELARQYDASVTERSTLSTILDSMSEAVYEVDDRGIVTRANRATCRLLGLPETEIVGARVVALFRWEDSAGRLLEEDEYLYRDTLTHGEAREALDRFFRGADGRRTPVSISSAPITGARGTPVGAVQVVRDITREREAETLKDQIISLVSHELRTPLGHIKGFASSLLDPEVKWDAATQKDFVAEIDREADRLAALVTDLLDMSKIESAGAASLEKGRIRPADLARDAIASVARVIADHAVSSAVPDQLAEIVVDGPQIERVLGNLVENAGKYSDPGTSIEVSAWMEGEAITFCVADQGPGIPMEYRDQIFEKFFRIKIGRPRTPGTGLGLPICKGIVDAHGGRIWVESVEGQGSRFCFSLPARG
ncbi:MAG: GAF domain-containing protein [Chloroflexi bacterium]|nr:GAF domain-containing protein [Chloroflexota bacterium]